MVERIKFEGIDDQVVVDLDDKHPGPDFARYAFVEHRPIVSFESDANLSSMEVAGIVGEHFFGGCLDCIGAAQQKKFY